MSNAIRSVSRDEHGRPTMVHYTEKRDDGKTETRHYKPYTGYSGPVSKTVTDEKGRSQNYRC